MTDASGILAGKAFVKFGVDDQSVSPSLQALEQKFRAWGNSFGGLGNAIGSKMGSTIAKGIVGAFAINIANDAITKFSDQWKEAMISGGSTSWLDVGIAIGDAINEGIRSARLVGPLLGAVGDQLGKLFGDVAGIDVFQTEKLQRIRAEADQREKRLRADEERTKSARDDAMGTFQSLMVGFGVTSGAIDPKVLEFEQQLKRVLDGYTNAGAKEEGLAAVADLRAAKAQAETVAGLQEEAEQRRKLVDALKDQVATYGLDEGERAMRELERLNASPELIAEAKKQAGYARLLAMMEDESNTDMTAMLPRVEDAAHVMTVGSVSARVLADVGQSKPANERRLKDIADATKETARNTARWEQPRFGP